jgi:hypothetical protein
MMRTPVVSMRRSPKGPRPLTPRTLAGLPNMLKPKPTRVTKLTEVVVEQKKYPTIPKKGKAKRSSPKRSSPKKKTPTPVLSSPGTPLVEMKRRIMEAKKRSASPKKASPKKASPKKRTPTPNHRTPSAVRDFFGYTKVASPGVIRLDRSPARVSPRIVPGSRVGPIPIVTDKNRYAGPTSIFLQPTKPLGMKKASPKMSMPKINWGWGK